MTSRQDSSAQTGRAPSVPYRRLFSAAGVKRSPRVASIAASAMLTVAGVVGMAGPAWAHDSIVHSNPAQDSAVDKMPERLTLEFSGEPRPGFNTVALSSQGNVLFSGEPQINGRTLTVDLPSDLQAKPGDYTVGYQITSSDGHATRGSFGFSLTGAGGEQASGGAAQSADDSQKGEGNNGVLTWALGLAGIVVIAGVLVVAIRRFRSIGRTSTE